MPVPRTVNDGNYRLAGQHGEWEIAYPFLDAGELNGNPMTGGGGSGSGPVIWNPNVNQVVGVPVASIEDVTFEMTRTMRVDQAFYKRPTLMSQSSLSLGSAFLLSAGNPQGIGNGLLEWRETWGNVPRTRYETTTTTWSQQFYTVSPAEVEELQFTKSAVVKCEYQRGSPFMPIIAPRVAVVLGFLVFFGGSNQLFQNGEWVPVQDSECGIYKAAIYYRRTMYAQYWKGVGV